MFMIYIHRLRFCSLLSFLLLILDPFLHFSGSISTLILDSRGFSVLSTWCHHEFYKTALFHSLKSSITWDSLQLVPIFYLNFPHPLYPVFWYENKRTNVFVQTNITWYITSHPSPTLPVCRCWKVMMATKLPPGKADVCLGRAVSLWNPWYCLWSRRLDEENPKIHPSPLLSPAHGLHNVLYILFYFGSSCQIHHPGLEDMRMEMPCSASASAVI